MSGYVLRESFFLIYRIIVHGDLSKKIFTPKIVVINPGIKRYSSLVQRTNKNIANLFFHRMKNIIY